MVLRECHSCRSQERQTAIVRDLYALSASAEHSPNRNPSAASSHSSAERLNGVESAAAAALKLSDAVFAYETGDADSLSIAVNRFLSDGESNIHGRSPTFREISTRSGAG